jgi:dipeptidyl aminopeptidase/acylaminoacyl peptidase
MSAVTRTLSLAVIALVMVAFAAGITLESSALAGGSPPVTTVKTIRAKYGTSNMGAALCRVVYLDMDAPPGFYAIASDGGHRITFPTQGGWLDADWSATTRRWLVFNQSLGVLDAHGRRLPFRPLPGSLLVEGARWSPDGRKILFTGLSGPPPHENLFTVNADGTGLRNLTHNVWQSAGAAWSPDGTMIVFHRQDESEDSGFSHGGLFVARADGTTIRPLVAGHAPDWSPDGKSIVFLRDDGLYVKTLGGGPPRRLDQNDDDEGPRWSPDGTEIAFTRRLGSTGDVYVIGADGGHLRRLTHTSAFNDFDQGKTALTWRCSGAH